MKKKLCMLLLGLSAFALAASADTFDFSYNVQVFPATINDVGSGTMTATYDAFDNEFIVTAISGTSSAYGTITGLLPDGSYQGNNNLLYYYSPVYLDYFGISFTVAGSGNDGSGDVNLYSDGRSYYEFQGHSADPGTFTLTLVPSSAPEPASAALLMVGVGGIGAAFWRRRMGVCRSSQG